MMIVEGVGTLRKKREKTSQKGGEDVVPDEELPEERGKERGRHVGYRVG